MRNVMYTNVYSSISDYLPPTSTPTHSPTGNLDHPGIVKMFDSFQDKNYFYIVTEYCEVST